MDAKMAASKMMALIGQAPMSRATRARYADLARQADPAGLLRLLERHIQDWPEVGLSVVNAGQVSFESIHAQVKVLHDDWLNDSRK